MKIRANGIDIEVEDSASINPLDGDLQARPAVLLIMGLGMQLTAWPAQLVTELVDAGYRVIRFDNRDAGLSAHFDILETPNLFWEGLKHWVGLKLRPAYTLDDMAADAVGVLDALHIEQAHVVGLSMGGMIAQRVALRAPTRVLSLTCISSSSGARGLPKPTKAANRALYARPRDASVEAAVDYTVQLFQAIGSPNYPTPESQLRAQALASVQRSFYPAGVARQMLAIAADSGRAAELSRVRCPTLVVHGVADPLLPYACAEDIAQRIAQAKLVGVEGMGHDLPPQPLQQILEALIAHLHEADEGPFRPSHLELTAS